MRIDWKAVNSGFREELAKKADVQPATQPSWYTPAVEGIRQAGQKLYNTPVIPGVPGSSAAGAAGLLQAGKNTYNTVVNAKNAIGNAVGAVGKAAPILLTGLLAAGMGGRGRQSPPQAHYGNASKRSYLSYDKSGVQTFASARPGEISYLGNGNVKMGNEIVNSLVWAARNRVANHVLNELTQQDQPAGSTAALNNVSNVAEPKSRHPEEIELTSEYPEIQEMLKEEQTRGYLEKLLKSKV